MKPTPSDGVRVIFGPFQIDAGRKTIMRSVTGFVQAKAMHIQQSELCATCHTLYTQAFSPTGQVIGSMGVSSGDGEKCAQAGVEAVFGKTASAAK